MNKGFVYILRLKNNKFYIGSTTDLKRRLHQHNVGRVKATCNVQPAKLDFFQEFENISLARKVEHKLKKFKRRDYIEKIIKEGLIRMGQ